ncbi:MAG: T9SS C-terminal target domain-containing protein [Calditrichaeota bacterium]|nr:MAG: T9SS C-terminal target domain-containing protein [Calditrichota bacterium]
MADESGAVPEGFSLQQNYPNPFNPETLIRYSVPVRSQVRISVLNGLGQTIDVLVDQQKPAGEHSVVWHATVPSGVYFYRLEATPVAQRTPAVRLVRKMVLLR